jgi:hypothetical protein
MFLRNAGWLSRDYKALYPRRQNFPTYVSQSYCGKVGKGVWTVMIKIKMLEAIVFEENKHCNCRNLYASSVHVDLIITSRSCFKIHPSVRLGLSFVSADLLDSELLHGASRTLEVDTKIIYSPGSLWPYQIQGRQLLTSGSLSFSLTVQRSASKTAWLWRRQIQTVSKTVYLYHSQWNYYNVVRVKKSTTFWDVTPCTLIEAHRRSEEHTAPIFMVEDYVQ